METLKAHKGFLNFFFIFPNNNDLIGTNGFQRR